MPERILASDLYMSAAEFRGWRQTMMVRNGWTLVDVKNALGCGVNSIHHWSNKGAPRYIALACRALAEEREPWNTSDNDLARSAKSTST